MIKILHRIIIRRTSSEINTIKFSFSILYSFWGMVKFNVWLIYGQIVRTFVKKSFVHKQHRHAKKD